MRPAFLFDGMLGRLCRKMRMLGYDCVLARSGESHLLLTRAESEGRVAVTTATRRLDRRGPSPVVIRFGGTAQMIAGLFDSIGEIPSLEPFTRCLECNAPLEELRPDEASGRVPPRIAADFNEFHVCRECGRVYWKGSHYEAMARQVELIEKILAAR